MSRNSFVLRIALGHIRLLRIALLWDCVHVDLLRRACTLYRRIAIADDVIGWAWTLRRCPTLCNRQLLYKDINHVSCSLASCYPDKMPVSVGCCVLFGQSVSSRLVPCCSTSKTRIRSFIMSNIIDRSLILWRNVAFLSVFFSWLWIY